MGGMYSPMEHPVTRHLVIEPAKEGKGRAFHATLLAFVTADSLWSGGGTDTEATRPVWVTLAGSDAELRAFVANLRTGHKATIPGQSYSRRAGQRFEVLRSAGYEFAWQRTPLGSTVTVYLPSLFRLDPGMLEPDGIRFCLMPPAEWLASQRLDIEASVAHLRRLGCQLPDEEIRPLVPLGALFAAYLDRRTRCPLIADPRFHTQLLCLALAQGIATFPEPEHYYHDRHWGVHRGRGFSEDGTARLGFDRAVACKVGHEAFEQFLAEQVGIYFDTVRGSHG